MLPCIGTYGLDPVWCGRKGLFRADPPSTLLKNARKVRWAQPPATTTRAVRGKAAPAALERRPSFSAFFLGAQEKGLAEGMGRKGGAGLRNSRGNDPSPGPSPKRGGERVRLILYPPPHPPFSPFPLRKGGRGDRSRYRNTSTGFARTEWTT